jgi:uroporphyrinogen decarboxylase
VSDTRTHSRFLATLAGDEAGPTPVWLMRQAGRYLPEYRDLKDRYGFWAMVQNPRLAAEVTLQPLRRFPLDAAILFSDIMTPLPATGVRIEFSPGPVVAHPIRTPADVAALRLPDSHEIAPFVAEAIALVRSATDTPLIGFAGAPLTLAAYLVQGSGGGDLVAFRTWLHAQPRAATALLDLLTELTIRYLLVQVEAGAQVVQLFDSWAGVHDTETYRAVGAPYVRRVLDALADSGVPRIYLAVGAAHLYPQLARLPVEALSIDWRTPLNQARKVLGPTMALQGNLDPAILLAPPEVVVAATRRVLRQGRGGPHVFNLGHGVLPGTPMDSVARLVDAVHAVDRDRLPAADQEQTDQDQTDRHQTDHEREDES